VAAAGVLLTATGTAGALCFGGWAAFDWLGRGRLSAHRARLSAHRWRRVPDGRAIERAYFGRLLPAAAGLNLPLAFTTRPRPWAAPAFA
jgi:hypothetical protein